MCRVDYADPCKFSSSREVKARKPHHCGECHRTIAAGERYVKTAGKSADGDFFSETTCLHCEAASGWLVRECNGYIFGQVEEELREHWQEDGINTRELAALCWGMKRKWKRRDGQMMPVPVVAKHAAAHAGG